MLNLCFVVHRYAPYQGGSEGFVQAMAEESLRRGHRVTVFTNTHKGDLNGIRVSSDHNILLDTYDLIIVHGGNCNSQDLVHLNAHQIPSPILYMLILPSESYACMQGLNNCKYIGCSSENDWIHVKKFGLLHKSYKVRHSVSLQSSIGIHGIFKQKYNIPLEKRLILSCGGFWAHKGMTELAKIIEEGNISNDILLVLTGYNADARYIPPQTSRVKSLILEEKVDVAHAMADMDLYVMNSTEEGFGLVLIEAMLNKKPWISRNIAGASLLNKEAACGITYDSSDQLKTLIENLDDTISKINTESNYKYAIENHLTMHTINDIESILKVY
jgi:glycosyltransferase involved in cell wall biosynthesis